MTRAIVIRKPAARRGFALAFVLLLALVASMMITATLTRQDAQSRLIARHIDDYQEHHDTLGVRAIVSYWLARVELAELLRLVRTDGVDHRFRIEGVFEIELSVSDGQGEPIADAAMVPDGVRELYAGILDRMPDASRAALRTRGPYMISPNSASWATLAALLEDGGDFADAVLARREREPMQQEEFFRIASTFTDAGTIQTLRQVLTFEPVLWRLDMVLTDETGTMRRAAMIAERRAAAGVEIHEWLTEPDLRAIEDARRAAEGDSREARRGRRP